MHSKFAVFSFGTLIAFITAMPDNVKTFAFIAIIMVAIDTISGVITAIVCHNLKSSKMRTHLIAKTTQYTIFATCGFAFTLAIQAWFPIEFCLSAIIACEVLSMLENLEKLQQVGGANMGPAAKFIRIVGTFFEASQESVNVVTTATVLPSEKNGEIITSTSVDNVSRRNTTTKESTL